MLGGGFTTFGIANTAGEAAGVDSMGSLLCQVQATEPLRLRRDKSVRHARLSDPGSFLGYISHSRFSLK